MPYWRSFDTNEYGLSPRGGWDRGLGVSAHYLPILAAAIVGVTLWLRRSRPGPGCCAACGYDLRGNPAGPCPECGASPNEVGAE